MKGLIFDTSKRKAIVGLAEENSLTYVAHLNENQSLSNTLFPMIEPLIEQIDYVAIGIGPGSYIGVRTGVAAAKLLAFARNIPVVEFSSILISIPEDQSTPFLFVGDAKMGEHFLISGELHKNKTFTLSPIKTIPAGEAKKHLTPFQTLIPELKTPSHLKWALAHSIDSITQKKTVSPDKLSISYIR